MSDRSRDASTGVVDRVLGAARRNPEGVLLLAAGCALLMRGVGKASDMWRDRESPSPRSRKSSLVDDVADDASGLMDTARDYASSLADTAVQYAEDTRNTVAERTGEIARGAKAGASNAVDRMVREQPLVVALLGIAAGAMMAGALPGTRTERNAFAPAGDRLKRSVGKAKERSSEVVDEHGLNRDGLTQAARDVARAFGEGLVEDGKPAPRKRTKASASGASAAQTSGTTRKSAPRRKKTPTPAKSPESPAKAEEKVSTSAPETTSDVERGS